MNCYCGSDKVFEECCNAIIQGAAIAKTPEQLMRSRYSAYATKNAKYIFNTYANETRILQSIQEIEQWAEQTQWLNLSIGYSDNIGLSSARAPTNNELAKVHFCVIYIHESTLYQMDEISRFIEENEQWRYLDGVIKKHIELEPPKRNEPCPCMSGRKFKQCCIRKLS